MELTSNKIKECDICKEPATTICYKCNSYFCGNCFKYVHNKPVNREYKKENIDPFIPIDIKCKIHNFPINLFCIDDKGIFIFFLIYFL